MTHVDRIRCCDLSCSADAEWAITAVRDGGRRAGPHWYADDTEACTSHVGDLLGHQPEATDTEEIYYEVRPIERRRVDLQVRWQSE